MNYLLDLLRSPEFYIQLLLIALALVLGWLIGTLITRRMRGYLLMHPPKHIEPDIVLKLLTILSPLIALLYLDLFKPISQTYAASAGNGIEAASALCFALLIARVVIAVMRSRPMGYFIAGVVMIDALLQVTGLAKVVADSLRAQNFHFGQYHLSLYSVIQGSIILVIVFWLAGLLSRTLESSLRRSSALSYSARELIVKFFRLFAYFTALLITFQVIGIDLTAFAVFGGALGVGVGLGLQKVTANFVSGITILLEKIHSDRRFARGGRHHRLGSPTQYPLCAD